MARRHAFGGFGGGIAFERLTHFVEFLGDGTGEQADDRAHAGDEFDKSFAGQLGDRFPDGGGGNAQLTGKGLVVQAATGGVCSVYQAVAEFFVDFIGERLFHGKPL